MTWNYRTAKHYYTDIHGNRVDAEYLTVHEVYYGDDKKPNGFIMSPSFPMEKGDLALMRKAFDKPPVLEFDDTSLIYTTYAKPRVVKQRRKKSLDPTEFWDISNCGGMHHNYKVWTWLEEST